MAEKKGEGLGISGFTLSVASLVSLVLSPLLGFFMSIVGLIFCIIQQKNKKTKLGRWGIILSVIGIILSILWFIIILKYLAPLVSQQGFPSI